MYVVGYGLLRTLNTKSSDHDRLDFGGSLFKRNIESSPAAHDERHRIITDKTDFQLSVRCGGGYLKRKRTIGVGADAYCSSLNKDTGSDDRITFCIPDFSGHGNRIPRIVLFGQDNVGFIDPVSDFRAGEQLCQHILDRFLDSVDTDLVFGIDAFVDKQVTGLIFNLFYNLRNRDVFHLNGNSGILCRCSEYVPKQRDCEYEPKQSSKLVEEYCFIHIFAKF